MYVEYIVKNRVQAVGSYVLCSMGEIRLCAWCSHIIYPYRKMRCDNLKCRLDALKI
jgi:hypothetical protein